MPRRRRRTGPPRCRHCNAPITFFRSPTTTKWLPFDPAPVDPFTTRSYPVVDRKAWDPNDLTAEIQVMRGCDVDDADQEVLDLSWHQLHRCTQGRAAWHREHRPEEATR